MTAVTQIHAALAFADRALTYPYSAEIQGALENLTAVVHAGLAELEDTRTRQETREAELDQVEIDQDRRASDLDRLAALLVPDVTYHFAYKIRAVLPTGASPDCWLVIGVNSSGRAVTWRVDKAADGELYYSAGHYFEEPRPEVNWARAVADLMRRSGAGEALNTLPAPIAARAQFTTHYDEILASLTDRYGLSRAKAREVMTMAAATGEAQSGPASASVTFNRMTCQYTIHS